MDIIAQLQALMGMFMELQTKLAEAQAKIAEGQVALDEAAKVNFEKGVEEGFAKGFAEGVASVPQVPGGFTQEQVDQMIAAAVEPHQKKVAELEGVIATMDAGMAAKIDQMVAEKMASFKMDLKMKYEEMQVIESQAETGFAEFLK